MGTANRTPLNDECQPTIHAESCGHSVVHTHARVAVAPQYFATMVCADDTDTWVTWPSPGSSAILGAGALPDGVLAYHM